MEQYPHDKLQLPCHEHKRCRILLIEDRPSDQELFRTFIRLYGHDGFVIAVVPTLHRALSEIKAHCHDLIIVDLSLPDSDGLETLRQVIELAPKTPIIVQSGCHSKIAEECLLMGAQDFIVKGDIEGQGLIDLLRKSILRNQVRANLLRQIELLTGLQAEVLKKRDRAGDLVLDSQGIFELENVIGELKAIAKNRY